MQRYLPTLARILLAQVFLIQVVVLIIGFFNTPDGYAEFKSHVGSIAPLVVLVQLVGGLSLLLGYKTKVVALVLAVYAFVSTFFLPVSALNYAAIAGGLVLLSIYPVTACSLDNLKK